MAGRRSETVYMDARWAPCATVRSCSSPRPSVLTWSRRLPCSCNRVCLLFEHGCCAEKQCLRVYPSYCGTTRRGITPLRRAFLLRSRAGHDTPQMRRVRVTSARSNTQFSGAYWSSLRHSLTADLWGIIYIDLNSRLWLRSRRSQTQLQPLSL